MQCIRCTETFHHTRFFPITRKDMPNQHFSFLRRAVIALNQKMPKQRNRNLNSEGRVKQPISDAAVLHGAVSSKNYAKNSWSANNEVVKDVRYLKDKRSEKTASFQKVLTKERVLQQVREVRTTASVIKPASDGGERWSPVHVERGNLN
ncbi:hypothetical protein CDAR_498681 [Caerostris darwini]|uniref:Uncharacterized protein n=1 Tax=Caerostris darwini TaxID=1538125 RepID=A0AAV4SJ68_9ARAC|nr:hypothetical protein CDAR_498681 [Caerostris darwini]